MTQLEREPEGAGITEAWNKEGRKFLVKDINDPDTYAIHLHDQILRDELFREVVAVRKSTRNKAYFRVRPEYLDGIRIDHGERDPLHNKTVQHLYQRLVDAESLEVRTTQWANRKASDLTLWLSKPFRKLTWKCDPLTRVWLDHTRYFQPDLCGFDPGAAHPGPNNAWIIIEVVHHHWPEEAAWDALIALSKANHLVLFYFVKDGKHENWVNKALGKEAFVIKITYYLFNGELYENSTRLNKSTGANNAAAQIKLSVLQRKDQTLAKEQVSRNRPLDLQG